MTSPFLGEVQIFGFGYAPYQWSICNGALVGVRQNSALFALLGVNYGGDGTQTFGLPNLFEQAACSQGQGPGLSRRVVGEPFGLASVSLNSSEMPAHNHTTGPFAGRGSTKTPGPTTGAFLSTGTSKTFFAPPVSPNAVMAPGEIGISGSSQPHENRQPFLALNYSIALAGDFPSFG
jgi:microcystin-dependent protein